VTDDSIPQLSLVSYRGHALQRGEGGEWTCFCGELTLASCVEDPKAFSAFYEHARDAEWMIWNSEERRYVSESEIREAVETLMPLPDTRFRLPREFLDYL